MQLKKCALYVLAAGLMTTGGSVVAGTQEQSSFAALQNVEAQTLSAQEMAAITGELSAADIAAALTAAALKYPSLATSLNKAAAAVLANAVKIDALLTRLHLN